MLHYSPAERNSWNECVITKFLNKKKTVELFFYIYFYYISLFFLLLKFLWHILIMSAEREREYKMYITIALWCRAERRLLTVGIRPFPYSRFFFSPHSLLPAAAACSPPLFKTRHAKKRNISLSLSRVTKVHTLQRRFTLCTSSIVPRAFFFFTFYYFSYNSVWDEKNKNKFHKQTNCRLYISVCVRI